MLASGGFGHEQKLLQTGDLSKDPFWISDQHIFVDENQMEPRLVEGC